MTPGPVFLDSGIFIAFLDRSDRYHMAGSSIGSVKRPHVCSASLWPNFHASTFSP